MSAADVRRRSLARASMRRAARAVVDAALEQPAADGGERWLQVNCALFPQRPGAPPFAPWADLAEALSGWRAEARFARFFFMRKPPGLRLRFQGRALDARLAPTLIAWLEEQERRNAIRGFRLALYEPERFRFGGVAGMRIAHDQFDRDSRAAIAYEALGEADRVELPRDIFSIVAANDLALRCVDDAAELWDIWQRLRAAVGGVAQEQVAEAELTRARAALHGAPAFVAALSPQATALLHTAQAANAATAAALRAAYTAGGMTVGPRAWLAAAIVFHWNRLGLTTDELRPLTARMLRLLSPDPED